jgi:hypothetical protein
MKTEENGKYLKCICEGEKMSASLKHVFSCPEEGFA